MKGTNENVQVLYQALDQKGIKAWKYLLPKIVVKIKRALWQRSGSL